MSFRFSGTAATAGARVIVTSVASRNAVNTIDVFSLRILASILRRCGFAKDRRTVP